jgi:hypothetical protein
MELPRGITGFRHVDDPPLPVSDFAVFRGHSYAAARALGGCVRSVEAPVRGAEANFARAILELPGGPIAILLNAHFPVIAFADPPAESAAPVRFIDAPALAERFQRFGTYEVWSGSELEVPLTPEACKQLAGAELEQVQYWRPRRVGDLVFNFWD